jgi:hypothetical protein
MLDEHSEAIESDLLANGWHLSDLLVTLSWRDLLVLTQRWASDPTSALCASMLGYKPWSTESYLIATLIDAVQMGNWQRAMRGRRNSIPKPKPVERPGAKARRTKTFGSDPIPISKFQEWWQRVTNRDRRG